MTASGKSTLAVALEAAVLQLGKRAYRLDGDNVRFGLNKDLGFSERDRNENIRRIGEVAKLFAASSTCTITAFISPYVADREQARKAHEEAGLAFIEVRSVSAASRRARLSSDRSSWILPSRRRSAETPKASTRRRELASSRVRPAALANARCLRRQRRLYRHQRAL